VRDIKQVGRLERSFFLNGQVWGGPVVGTTITCICIKQKRSEADEQPRELWIRLNPDIACQLEEHEKQQAAPVAAVAPISQACGQAQEGAYC